MCCKFLNEKKWRSILAVVSACVLIMGIVIIILAVKIKQAEVFENADSNVQPVGNAAFYLMIIFASGAILVAILGGLTAWIDKWYCLGCFGFWALVIAVIYLIAGIILFVIGGMSDDMLMDFCAGNKYQNTKYFADTINKVDVAMANWTSTYMCTTYCPCPNPSKNSNYTNKWKDENKLHDFNRTLRSNDLPKYTPFIFINTTQPTDDAYTSFEDCYRDIIADNSTSVLKNTMYDLGDSMLDFLNYLEKSFACNGICTPGLFFFFQEVTLGPPTSNCIDGLKDIFKENTTNIGAALIISFAFTILAFAVQYNLWNCKKCKKNK